MDWLLFEDKMIALDMFNTMLDPIMTFIVIIAIILTPLWFFDHMEYKSTGWHILSIKTSNIIKVVLVLILTLIIVVCLTNVTQYYLEQLMRFDGYMYIDYKKIIIKIQY